jgi:phage terminase large subunit GpA-like protein
MGSVLPFWPEERAAWAPPEDLTVSEWADKYRILSHKSEKRGPWETSFNPVMRKVMDAFGVDCIEEITLVKPTQSGGTDGLILNNLGYAIMQDPGTTLVVEPSEDLATEVSTERIDDMIKSCDALAEVKSSDEKSITKKKAFKSMTVYFGWAGSPTSLASRPVRYVLFDEVDKYPLFSGKEASPLALGKERTNTFKRTRKIIYTSTPTTDDGYVSKQEKEAQARFRYLVSCPHCGHKQQFTFDGIKFGEDHDPIVVSETAWYECAECGLAIHEDQRMEMVRRGDWYDLISGLSFDDCIEKIRPKSVGFQFNRIYTPWFTFGEIAAEFLRCKDIPEKLMNFKNSWMAETWIEFIPEQATANIISLKDHRREGEVPEDALVLTAGVDVQKAYFQYVIQATARNTESWLVRDGEVETFEDLAAVILGTEYEQIGTGKMMKVRLCNIDTGYRTDEVYDFVRKYPQVMRAIKGSVNLKSPYSPSKLDYYPNGKRIPGGLVLWILDTFYWKNYVARRMSPEKGKPVLWHVHSDISRRYAEQMQSEHRITIRAKKSRKVTEEWVKKSGFPRNESRDCSVYAAAAAHMLGIGFVAQQQTQNRPVVRRVRSEGVAAYGG